MSRGYRDRQRRIFALWLGLVAALAASCDNDRYGQFDDIAERESRACPQPHVATPIIIRGLYEDQGIRHDYSRLAPRPDPRKDVDMGAVARSFRDPRQLEQVYHDAMGGNGQAVWLACQYDVGARNIGRQAARYLASLTCQTFFRCNIEFQKLPFSQDTASGARILELIGRAFQDLSYRLGVEQDLVFRALELVIGARIAGHSSELAYKIENTTFDSYRNGVLIEAKGPGYATFVKKGEFREFFTGGERMLDQAQR